MKKSLLFFFLVLSCQVLRAIPATAPAEMTQNQKEGVIKGTVTDDLGDPLPGVHIRMKDFKGGYVTDINGAFQILTQKAREEITFSFVGFLPQTITAKPGDVLKIKLKADVGALSEVVVTGFVTKSKNSYTGSQTTVTREQLLSTGSKSLLKSITSFVPGMAILEDNLAGSNPNSRPNIELRGRSSFEGAANVPLFIVDGAQVTLDYVFDMDMNDVEQVTVLKDASATALYGAKGAAGVIVITTKVLEGGALRFSYNGTLRVATPDLSEYNLLNAAEKLEYERLAGLYTDENPEAQYLKDQEYADKYQLVQSGINTNWLAKPLRVGISQNHNLGISGGDGNARYNVTLRYGKDEGVMKGSSRERMSTNFRLSYNTDKRLYLSNMSTISYVKAEESPYGSFSEYAAANPYDSPYDEKGGLRPYLSFNRQNPLYEASIGNYNRSNSLTFMNVTDLTYWVSDAFKIDGSFALTLGKGDRRIFVSPLSKSELTNDIAMRGSLTESNNKSINFSGKLMATYNKYLTDNLFSTTTLGSNIESASGDNSAYRAIGFYSDKLGHPAFASRYPLTSPSGGDDITRSVGVFLNSNLMYDNRYYVDLTIRAEGASQFGVNNRFAPFWSAGGGWNIHNEAFMKDSGFKTLKLRASTGYTGSANFPPYMALTTLKYDNTLNYGKGMGAVPITIGNPDLRWQRLLTNNVGLDLTLFEGLWDLSIDAYVKTTDDLLLDVTKAPSVGVTTVRQNLGKIENRGIEWQTRVVPIRTNDWHWAISFNGAYNKNIIKKISNALKSQNEKNLSDTSLAPLPVYEEGGSMSDLKVVPSAGIDPVTGKEIFIKPDGTYTFEYDSRYKKTFGVTTPFIIGALNSYLTYKQWSMTFVFGYSLGAVEYNQTLASRVEGSNPTMNADRRVFEDRWRTPGVPAKYKDIADQSVPYQTSRFVQTNNSLDLRTVSMAYEFKPEQLKGVKLRGLRLELLTNNLFYFSTIKRERGLDYPFERSVELSMRMSF